MRYGNALDALHQALAAALYRDLPDIHYETRDWATWNKMDKQAQAEAIRTNTYPRLTATRRPQDDDVEVIMFPQNWGSTTLGYGGMGGAAVSSAYTVVVSDHLVSCVYFGRGQLAYRVNYNELTTEGREHWMADLRAQDLADCRTAPMRYSKAHTS